MTPGAAGEPLVSCIMPTYNRRPFVADALRYFMRQDYPNLELIVLDDGTDPISDLIPDDPRIRYVYGKVRASLGTKRNLGCKAAKGKIIAYWDDDDWYAPNRISYQVSPLLAGRADLTVLGETLFYSFPAGQYWACSREVHGRMFYEGMVGGTQVFYRNLWQRGPRYLSASLAEEVDFIKKLLRRGARVETMSNKGVFIYGRHESNSWSFSTGKYLDSRGWRQVERPPFLPITDLAARASTPPPSQPPKPGLTSNRRNPGRARQRRRPIRRRSRR